MAGNNCRVPLCQALLFSGTKSENTGNIPNQTRARQASGSGRPDAHLLLVHHHHVHHHHHRHHQQQPQLQQLEVAEEDDRRSVRDTASGESRRSSGEHRSSSTTTTTSSGLFSRFGQGAVAVFIVFLNILQLFGSVLVFLAQRLADEIIATEHMFMLMTNLYAFMCQFFFFTLCDVTLLKAEHKHKRGKVISALTTLLLYSIFTYFASKIRDTFVHNAVERYNHRWPPSRARTCVLRALRVALEFIKAAIVILCLREQGLQYHFDAVYSSATFLYYVCTEKLFVDSAIRAARAADLAMFDGLEHLYVPIALHAVSIALTTVGVCLMVMTQHYLLYAILSSYFTLYLPTKNLIWNYVTPLVVEQRTFASFKVATVKELQQWDDICAVCLERMTVARVTPCNHLFHPACLKRCLQTSMQCPLCKHDFIVAGADNTGNLRRYYNHRRW